MIPSLLVLSSTGYAMPEPSGNKTASRNRARQAEESAPSRPESTEETRPREIGGPRGPEPTRYGDWEVKGRCSDF